jgi:thymidylate synthase ThyX
MGQMVKPRVFLVGYPTVHRAGLEAYLRYTGQQDFLATFDAATADGVSEGEALCSLYAKLCYKSLVRGKNANITRTRDVWGNLTNAHDQGHGCYDIETEVLTKHGWKAWPDVTASDELATLTSHSHEIEYHKPLRLVAYEHRGRMYRVEAQGVDLLVTPDHNMLACVTTTKEGRKKLDFSLIKASELDTKSHAYTKVGHWAGGKSDYRPDCVDGPLTGPVMALLGFAIGDGNIEAGTSRLTFHLRRARKIAWLRSLAGRLGPEWGELRENLDHDKYSFTVPAAYIEMFRDMYASDGEKRIPQLLLTLCTQDTLTHLFDGLMQADGSEGRTGDCFDTTSPHLPGQFQQLCLHLGLAANVVYEYGPDERPTSFGDKPLTRLSVLRRKVKPEVNKFADTVGRSFWVDGWEGTVYCAEVPNNTLYVRRNGIPVWSGNSVFEHAYLNFVITDCSRVFTHELVRHRVGTAFSQTSGRFCRLDQIDLVWDMILEGCEDLALELLQKIEDTVYLMECRKGLRKPNAVAVASIGDHQAEYCLKLRARGIENWDQYRWLPDDACDFDFKKQVTSAIRRLAPNGQSNEIGLSVNLRAIRQLVQVRTAAQAEWEIRDVFAQIYETLQGRFPTLFHGARIKEYKGLPVVYGMKTQPYEIPAGDPKALDFFTVDQMQAEIARRGTAA